MLLDLCCVVRSFTGRADQKCALDGRMDFDELADSPAPPEMEAGPP
jgi:hypothetical protein